MRKDDYIISYDIKDKKRLAKVARYLEKETFRIQYSIFLAKNFTKNKIYNIADNLIELIDPNEDDIRIYKIKNYGIYLGKAYNLKEVFIIK